MQRKIITLIWLSIVFVVAASGLKKIYDGSLANPNGDAILVYLPGARKLLADPVNFITSDILSYSVAPLGYFWPAVWGADDFTTRLANCGLFLVCIYLVWRIASRLGGMVAAMAASLTWATTHTLLHAIPLVLTEAIFLFGFMLFLFGLVEAVASGAPRIRWFVAASAGLTITLLSRPVLQYLILGVLAFLLVGYAAWRLGHARTATAHVRTIWRRTTYAVLLALVLPVLVVVKNGVYFGSWGLGTGSGAGLYYGVHPLHLGEEPYYTNFQYDVGHTASTINPQTRGNLEVESDRWQKQIALHIVAQTTLWDNVRFFASKARSWLLYSPIERHFEGNWRTKRQALAVLVVAALVALGVLWLRRGVRGVVQAFDPLIARGGRSSAAQRADAPAPTQSAAGMALCFAALLLLTLGMVAQFLPILYNGRYNGAFLDPLFILLGSVSLGLLTRHLHIPSGGARAMVAGGGWWLRGGGQVLVLALLAYAHHALQQSLQRHERLVLDPYRLGPIAEVLDGDAFGHSRAEAMTAQGANTWITTQWHSRLVIPLEIPPGVDLESVYEAVWRVRLQVPADVPASCRSVSMRYSHPATVSSPVPSEIFLERDGQMHTYAVSAGFGVRPRESGDLVLAFSCPTGTRIRWAGAEIVRSTIAESSRELIHRGTSFSPYQTHDPHLPDSEPASHGAPGDSAVPS